MHEQYQPVFSFPHLTPKDKVSQRWAGLPFVNKIERDPVFLQRSFQKTSSSETSVLSISTIKSSSTGCLINFNSVCKTSIICCYKLKYCVTGGDYIDNSGLTIANKYSLNYNDIFTYNIAATKELDTLTNLENTVTNLENTVTNLQSKNLVLEQELTLVKNALNNLLTELGKNTI